MFSLTRISLSGVLCAPSSVCQGMILVFDGYPNHSHTACLLPNHLTIITRLSQVLRHAHITHWSTNNLSKTVKFWDVKATLCKIYIGGILPKTMEVWGKNAG